MGIIRTLAVMLLLAAPTLAQDAATAIEGSLRVELNTDRFGRRGSRAAHSDAYTKSELDTDLALPGGFSINGVFKLEPIGAELSPTQRGFRDSAGWVDELTLSWTGGPLRLFAGKIHPRFGFAWARAPSLYGTDVAEDSYELEEKLGFGAELAWSTLAGLTDRIGTHDVRLEIFRADTSVLANSAFSPRYTRIDPETGITRSVFRNRRASGGADNTSGTDNWVASAQGTAVPLPLGQLDYTLGVSSRRAGDDSRAAGTAARERGLVAGLAWAVPLTDRITATPLIEWARLDDSDAVRGARREVVTAGFELARGPISAAYVHAWQRDRGPAPARLALHGASVSYDLSDAAPWLAGFTSTLGWRRVREDGVSVNDFGAQLVYATRF